MASYTPNLDLLKKSPVTDGDDMFNVETMLNENWDRIDRGVGDYTTPAQKMGLTGDLSVGASLGVLADIGNVHVWRKTVITEEEIPAGYKLVDDNTDRTLDDVPNALINLGNSNQRTAYINCADSITVDDGGGISLNSATTHYQANDALNAASWLRGKYIKLYYINDFGNWFGPPALDQNKTYYVPNDAQISVNSATIIVDKLQRVDAYPLTPAGTHITYLTSTNRNAYQEGTDGSEKPAGYKLGSKITGNIALTDRTNESSTIYWNYSDQVDVSSDGKVSLRDPNEVSFNAEQSNAVNMAKYLLGKFIMTDFSNTDFSANTVYFIPNDASVLREPSGTRYVYTSKYQTVTGYPATPAGTTIEYLGVLGEKSQVQVISYVGTETYGEANPCSVTANFPIKALFSLGYGGTFGFDPPYTSVKNGPWGDKETGIMISEFLTTTFVEHMGFIGSTDTSIIFGKKSEDGKTFYWYTPGESSAGQLNSSGYSYYFLALG